MKTLWHVSISSCGKHAAVALAPRSEVLRIWWLIQISQRFPRLTCVSAAVQPFDHSSVALYDGWTLLASLFHFFLLKPIDVTAGVWNLPVRRSHAYAPNLCCDTSQNNVTLLQIYTSVHTCPSVSRFLFHSTSVSVCPCIPLSLFASPSFSLYSSCPSSLFL